MRPQSVRLLLVANLRLGEPLRTALPLTDDARHIVLDSTLDSWRQIQDYAIDREVDALVLNGNTVVADQLSSHAEFALIEGLELLAEVEVPVVIHPGSSDPLTFWKELLIDLGTAKSNISVISPQSTNRYLLLRDKGRTVSVPEKPSEHINEDHVIAQLVTAATPLPDLSRNDDSRFENSPSPIIALDEITSQSHTLPPGIDLICAGPSVIHQRQHSNSIQQDHCTSPQPLSLAESQAEGEAGCMLIDFTTESQTHLQTLPTSVVQFHQIDLDLSPSTDWEDAALAMQTQIESLTWGPQERLKLITWNILGNDRLSNIILDGDDSHLLAAWNESFAAQNHNETLVIHGFQPDGQFPLDHNSACSGKELAEALFEIEQSADQPDIDRLTAIWATDKSSAALLTRLRPVLNPAQIGNHSESVVTQWLTQSDPENLSHENYTS